MAQVVERIIGSDEVRSSTLRSSTLVSDPSDIGSGGFVFRKNSVILRNGSDEESLRSFATLRMTG